MRHNLSAVFCLALCLIFSLPLAAQNYTDWTQPTVLDQGDTYGESEGRGLSIRSHPSGARLYVDGIEMGKTPLYLESLRPGAYFVRLEREGYRERRFTAFVRSGSLVNIFIEMKEAAGKVLLKIQGGDAAESVPPSRISVDGVVYYGPELELPMGFRNVLVRAFGWEDASETLYVEDESYSELEINMKQAPFKLSNATASRLRFNPANSGSLGTTSFSFEVSAPGRGRFIALDQSGKAVFAKDIGPFETWSQSFIWDGRDSGGEILSDGIYTLMVQAVSMPWDNSVPDDSTIEEENLSLEVTIDSSRVIFPLSMASGKSGLLFASLPTPLPALSFQIEGSLMAGSPYASGGVWKSLPFAAAFRISPIERLELSAALNVIPHFQGTVGAGGSGGVKWAFLKRGIFGGAAAFNFSWTGKTALTPFGMASGFEFYIPLKLDLGRIFSLILSPSILWTGDEGFPWEGAPRLLVSGGVMMRMTYFIAGLSVRPEFKFTGGAQPPILAGAEIKFFPPPSSFVFSFNGGVWARDSSAGGFGGFAIGMIY